MTSPLNRPPSCDFLHLEQRAKRACAERSDAQDEADLPLTSRAALIAVRSISVISRPRSARPRLRRPTFIVSVRDLARESVGCSEGIVHPAGANCRSISGSAWRPGAIHPISTPCGQDRPYVLPCYVLVHSTVRSIRRRPPPADQGTRGRRAGLMPASWSRGDLRLMIKPGTPASLIGRRDGGLCGAATSPGDRTRFLCA